MNALRARRGTALAIHDKRVRLITAHPDDSVWYRALIDASGSIDEALLSIGQKGKQPKTGSRLDEERAAARILGLQQVLDYPGMDRELPQTVAPLAKLVAEDAADDHIDVLVGNLLTDHDDHRAAGMIAIAAAIEAAKLGRPMGVLLLHHHAEGEYWLEKSPDHMARTFAAVKQHASQGWRFREDVPPGPWVAIPGGGSMHEEDFYALAPYPLVRDETYTWIPPEAIAAQAAGALALIETE